MMGWPLRKKRRGERGVRWVESWGAALGFRQFRYLALCKSEPVEGLAVLALALAHLLKSNILRVGQARDG